MSWKTEDGWSVLWFSVLFACISPLFGLLGLRVGPVEWLIRCWAPPQRNQQLDSQHVHCPAILVVTGSVLLNDCLGSFKNGWVFGDHKSSTGPRYCWALGNCRQFPYCLARWVAAVVITGKVARIIRTKDYVKKKFWKWKGWVIDHGLEYKTSQEARAIWVMKTWVTSFTWSNYISTYLQWNNCQNRSSNWLRRNGGISGPRKAADSTCFRIWSLSVAAPVNYR